MRCWAGRDGGVGGRYGVGSGFGAAAPGLLAPASGAEGAMRQQALGVLQAAFDGAHGFEPFTQLVVAALGIAQRLALPLQLFLQPPLVRQPRLQQLGP